MFICNNCMEKPATWTLMSGKYEWCDDCVPKGCSCNYESIFYENEDDNNIDEMLKSVKTMNYKAFKYPEKIKSIGNHIKEITDKKELIKIFDGKNVEELKKNIFVPLDEKGEEFPCVEIEPKVEFNIMQVGEVIYSMRWNCWYLITDEYKDSFRCYPVLNEIPLGEYYSFDSKDRDKLELDNSNPIYIKKVGIDYNNDIIDIYLSTYEVYGYKEKSLYDFLQLFIYCNQDFKNFEDEECEYNEDIGFFFEEVCEDILEFKKLAEKTKKNYEILKNYLIDFFSEPEDDINGTDLNVLSKREIGGLMRYLSLYHYYNNAVKYSDVYNPTVKIGCDCGCGGDMLDDDSFEYYGDLAAKRERVFKGIMHIIY